MTIRELGTLIDSVIPANCWTELYEEVERGMTTKWVIIKRDASGEAAVVPGGVLTGGESVAWLRILGDGRVYVYNPNYVRQLSFAGTHAVKAVLEWVKTL